MKNRFLIGLLTIFSITACSDNITSVDVPTPTEIQLDPVANSFTQLEVGETLQVVATVLDQFNNPIPGAVILWESSNSNIIQVDRSGLVTARSLGVAQVIALTGSIRSVVYVNVVRESVSVVDININVPSIGLIVGDTIVASATALSAKGDTITRYATSWTSSVPAVATISSIGVITGVSNGTSTITATIDGVSTSVDVQVVAREARTITVAPVAVTLERGETQIISSTVFDQFGKELNDVLVTWESSNSTTATVNSSGLVSAIGPGTAIITAKSGELRAQAIVFVTLEMVSRVELNVEFPVDGFVVGSSVTATATAFSAREDIITRYNVTWATSDSDIAVVSPTGVITAVSEGTATISATINGVSATVLVTVIAAPPPVTRVPSRIELLPSATQIERGATTIIAVIVFDQFNEEFMDAVVTWSSTNPLIATVSNTGTVTGLQLGQTEIVATSGTLESRATVFVVAETVSSVVVVASVPADGLVVGTTATAEATALTARNDVISGFTVTWSSSNTEVATVSSGGIITAVSEGIVVISATISGVTGTIEVTTRLEPVASVSLETALDITLVGRTNQVIPTLLSSTNDTLTTAQRTFVWATSNSEVATVSNTGLITGVSSGSVRITLVVTSPNTTPRVGFIDVVVEQVAIDSVEVVNLTLAADTLVLGTAYEFLARAFDEDGVELSLDELDDRTFTWAVSAPLLIQTPGTATTHLNRWYTAIGEGNVTITVTIDGVDGELDVLIVPPAS